MLHNPEIEAFLSNKAQRERTRERIETSRKVIEEMPLLTGLKEAFCEKSGPSPSRLREICEKTARQSIEMILGEFCKGVGANPFFVFPMQGQSTEFAQRTIFENNALFDASIDVINSDQLRRYKARSRDNLAERGISFFGRGAYVYVYRAGGLVISHWAHNATMSSLAGSKCWRERLETLCDGQLIEKSALETFMFESSLGNSILISIEPKQDVFPASLTFSAVDRTLKFQNPSDHLDSRIQLSLSLLQELECHSAIPVMKHFLGHPRHYIRWHALQSILGIDAFEALDELLQMADCDENEEVRYAARETFAMIQEERLRHAS